jgi:hypothetical protein
MSTHLHIECGPSVDQLRAELSWPFSDEWHHSGEFHALTFEPDGRLKAKERKVMPSKRKSGWPMKNDRQLIALSKTHTLEAIADQLERSPKFVLRRAQRLGLSIKLKR